MIQEPARKQRPFGNVQMRDVLSRLEQTQKMKHAVERADFTVRCDHCHRLALVACGANEITVIAQRRDRLLQFQRRDQ